MRIRIGLPVVLSLAGLACSDDNAGRTPNALEAVCVDATSPAPQGAWLCGEERTVECTDPSGTPVDYLYVDSTGAPSCGNSQLAVSDAGPYALGTHLIDVSRTSTNGTELACSATLHVVDTTPPRLVPRTTALWPPNHKLRRLTAADCVEVVDACDAHVELHFTHATSDEPADARGDGHHQPDLQAIGCDAIELRSERQGGSNGRVYTLGVRAVDASGNETLGSCTVGVAHDQSGSAPIDDGVAIRIDFPASCAN